jgi:hypothetical protein
MNIFQVSRRLPRPHGKWIVLLLEKCSTERLPIDKDIAINFIKSGLIMIIRHELKISVRYIDSDECFELVGHRQAIDRAKYRLLHAGNSKDTVARVPSEKDTCGLIIGTKGARMKRIKAQLQINHGIGVEWDKKSKEIVLASAVPLATERKSELYALVQLVMARQLDI